MINSQSNPIRWPEIIKKVDDSSMVTTSNHHLQKTIQQKAYRESLEHQIHENYGQQAANRNQKLSEFKVMNDKVSRAYAREQQKKKQKRGVEKYYQIENEKIINELQTKRKQRPYASQNNQEGIINKIFKSVDERKLNARRNFQLQNSLNNIQKQMKYQDMMKNNGQKLQDSSQYNNYVQKMFKNRQIQRQLWKNKYIRNKSTNEMKNLSTDQQRYRSFLDRQVKQKKESHSQIKNDVVDQRVSRFNHSPQNPNSSPAYLGRGPVSFDRQKQLNILNKHLLKGSNISVFKANPPQTSHEKLNHQDFSFNQAEFDKKSEKSDHKSIDSLVKISNSEASMRNRKPYKVYDLISGEQRNIYL